MIYNKENASMISALLMLTSGVAMCTAGFIVAPVGEISDSVLWYLGQTLMYAGSVFGVTVYVQSKFNEKNGTRKS